MKIFFSLRLLKRMYCFTSDSDSFRENMLLVMDSNLAKFRKILRQGTVFLFMFLFIASSALTQEVSNDYSDVYQDISPFVTSPVPAPEILKPSLQYDQNGAPSVTSPVPAPEINNDYGNLYQDNFPFITSTLLVPEIRVKIGSFEKVRFSSPEIYKIIQKEDQRVLYQGKDQKSAFVFGGNINIFNTGVYKNALIIETGSESIIKINERKYRGKVELRVSGDRIEVINIVNIEKYLYGVINREMSPKWPIEALKAQAVISRTFALGNLNKHQNEGYDLCSGWHCQVYGEVNDENLKIREAVDSTKGEVVVYGDKIIRAPFHACCGGMTAEGNLVWNGERYPYLRTVVDPFCKNSPYQRWKEIISELVIIKKFLKNGKNIGKIYSITPLKKGCDGRFKDVLIEHAEGRLTISSNDFRLILDPTIIKSTNFTIIKRDDEFIFSGCGWGHGVGLCQWGAKAMAESGKSYTQILRFYYPETTIKKYN